MLESTGIASAAAVGDVHLVAQRQLRGVLSQHCLHTWVRKVILCIQSEHVHGCKATQCLTLTCCKMVLCRCTRCEPDELSAARTQRRRASASGDMQTKQRKQHGGITMAPGDAKGVLSAWHCQLEVACAGVGHCSALQCSAASILAACSRAHHEAQNEQ